MNKNNLTGKILWVSIFGITMGFFEASVVVYLRAIYYPDGFVFPLKLFRDYIIAVEVFREAASIFMLVAVAALAGRRIWERFACFILAFGIWDVFYYVFLKITLDWPSSLLEWDVLFLIPLPWIGPVIAPVSIALLMIVAGILIICSSHKGHDFRPTIMSWVLALGGIIIVLYSFMYDTGATLHQQLPKPYRYELLILGDLLFIASFLISYFKMGKHA